MTNPDYDPYEDDTETGAEPAQPEEGADPAAPAEPGFSDVTDNKDLPPQ